MSFVQMIDKQRMEISWSSIGKGAVALLPYFLGWLLGLVWWVTRYIIDAFVVGFKRGTGG